MILPDVNVLMYSFRADSEDHAQYRDWLDSVVNGDSIYGMSPQVLGSLIRICTHTGVYRRPSKLEEALQFCNVLLKQPNCQTIQPGPRHWDIFNRLCSEEKVTGNLVPDAWFAALAIESGCQWITTDGDYARFKDLDRRRPF